MFGSIGGSVSSSQSETERNPWAEQIPYLTGGFEQAESLMNRGIYPGQWWVDPNQTQRDAWGGGASWAQQNLGMGQEMIDIGRGMLPGMGTAQDFYQKQLQGGAGITNPYESGQYQDIIQQNMWGDQYQNMLDAANQNLMDVQAMQNKDARLGAAMSGMSGGSDQMRKYAANALGAQTQSADIENRLRMQGQQYGTQQADQWAQQNLGGQMQDLMARRGSADYLGGLGQQGLGLMQQGYGFGQGAYGDMAGWGDYQGGFDRERLAGEMSQWNAPWQNLQNYWNVIGSGNWGGTEKMTSSSSSASGSLGF